MLWRFVLVGLVLVAAFVVGCWLQVWGRRWEAQVLEMLADHGKTDGYAGYAPQWEFRRVGDSWLPAYEYVSVDDGQAPYDRFEVGQVWRSESSGKTVTVAGKHRGVLWLWCEATSAFNTEDPGFIAQYYELVGAVDVR